MPELVEKTDLADEFGPEVSPANGKIRVKLICPLFPVETLEADQVLLPAKEGNILILPDRAPIFLTLTAGQMVIYNKGEKPVVFYVSGGVCEVRRNLCPVLAWGMRAEEVDETQIAEQLKRAEAVFDGYRSNLGKSEAASRIEFWKMIMNELKNHSKK